MFLFPFRRDDLRPAQGGATLASLAIIHPTRQQAREDALRRHARLGRFGMVQVDVFSGNRRQSVLAPSPATG